MAEGRRGPDTVVFTDMMAYSAPDQAYESKSLSVLDHHNRVLRSGFPEFGLREVKTVGVEFLVEFDSALDVSQCTVEIQGFIRDYAVQSNASQKNRARTGIPVGEVIQAGDDVLGDAVNIASRIEPWAEPQGN